MHRAGLDASGDQALAELSEPRGCLDLRAALGRGPEDFARSAGPRPQDVVDGGVVDRLAPPRQLAAEHEFGLRGAEVRAGVVRVDQAPVLVGRTPVGEGVEGLDLGPGEVEPLAAAAIKVLYPVRFRSMLFYTRSLLIRLRLTQ